MGLFDWFTVDTHASEVMQSVRAEELNRISIAVKKEATEQLVANHMQLTSSLVGHRNGTGDLYRVAGEVYLVNHHAVFKRCGCSWLITDRVPEMFLSAFSGCLIAKNYKPFGYSKKAKAAQKDVINKLKGVGFL